MFILKLFWAVVQVVFLIAVAAWLYFTLTGEVSINWGAYKISTTAGVAAAVLFTILTIIIFFAHIIGDLVRLPSDISRKMRDNRRAKGHQALLRAMSSAGAGDFKNAYYLAHRAQKFLPESEQGLALLLQAHAAKSRGQDANATAAFEALIKNPDTSVLGVQGLLQKRVLDGDVRGALDMARTQAANYPKNAHLLRPVYDLERRNKLWNDALITLGKLQKAGVIARDEANLDRAVLWIIVGDMAAAVNETDQALRAYKHAYHAAPKFAPTILRLSRTHLKLGQRYRAVSLAKRAIEKHFHPSFIGLWVDLVPQDKNLRWFEWLVEHAPPSAAALNALAKAAIDLSLWGEAKSALMRAEKIEPTKDIYRLWVELEEKNNAPQHIIRQWLDRLESAQPEKGWVCKKTSRNFVDYTPVVEPETLFNTLEWGDVLGAKLPAKMDMLLSPAPLHDIVH